MLFSGTWTNWQDVLSYCNTQGILTTTLAINSNGIITGTDVSGNYYGIGYWGGNGNPTNNPGNYASQPTSVLPPFGQAASTVAGQMEGGADILATDIQGFVGNVTDDIKNAFAAGVPWYVWVGGAAYIISALASNRSGKR